MALRRLLDLQSPISLISGDDSLSAARLSDAEWTSLSAICHVLRPVEKCCKTEGGQTYTTLSMVLLQVDIVRAELDQAVPNETPIAKYLRHDIRDEVKKRFELSGIETELHVLAMMLDPRFRNQRICMNFMGQPATAVDLWRHVKSQLIAQVSRCIKSSLDGVAVETSSLLALPRAALGHDESHPLARLDRARQDAQTRRLNSEDQIGAKAAAEVEAYLNGDAAPTKDEDGSVMNVLNWWKTHAYQFPNVATMARSILAIPASSVPSERVFSKAGELLTVKRLQMKAKQVDMFLFLHDNKEEIMHLRLDHPDKS